MRAFVGDYHIVSRAPTLGAWLGASTLSDEGLLDRARGLLLGHAVGNLLGIPHESMWYSTIEALYPNGVSDIDPQEAHMPMDDDLAQAVELGEALLEDDCASTFARRLIAWSRDNGRGMGNLTYRVIGLLENGHPPFEAARLEYEENRIASNGALMRCSPVALARFRQPDLLVGDSAATCAVTHYAPTCQWACILVNVVNAAFLRGAWPDLPRLMALASQDGSPDMLASASDDGIPTHILSCIAGGQPLPPDASWLRVNQVLIGHTLLAMQTAFWAAQTTLDFENALRQIVEAGGDTDTNGAIVGSVLGARYGASAIPERWLACIPQRERIENLAVGLLELSGRDS